MRIFYHDGRCSLLQVFQQGRPKRKKRQQKQEGGHANTHIYSKVIDEKRNHKNDSEAHKKYGKHNPPFFPRQYYAPHNKRKHHRPRNSFYEREHVTREFQMPGKRPQEDVEKRYKRISDKEKWTIKFGFHDHRCIGSLVRFVWGNVGKVVRGSARGIVRGSAGGSVRGGVRGGGRGRRSARGSVRGIFSRNAREVDRDVRRFPIQNDYFRARIIPDRLYAKVPVTQKHGNRSDKDYGKKPVGELFFQGKTKKERPYEHKGIHHNKSNIEPEVNESEQCHVQQKKLRPRKTLYHFHEKKCPQENQGNDEDVFEYQASQVSVRGIESRRKPSKRGCPIGSSELTRNAAYEKYTDNRKPNANNNSKNLRGYEKRVKNSEHDRIPVRNRGDVLVFGNGFQRKVSLSKIFRDANCDSLIARLISLSLKRSVKIGVIYEERARKMSHQDKRKQQAHGLIPHAYLAQHKNRAPTEHRK